MADIFGTDADETIKGTSAVDRLFGRGGNDKLRGYGGNDQLYGEAGNDSLNGGAGADIMYGGSGNDTYYVDNPGDVISEETVPGVDDGGKDRVYSSITFTLPAFVENLVLTGSEAIDATGNNLANTITGNAAANILTGLGGSDTLTGGLGADTFMFGPADATSTDTVTDFTDEDWVGIKASDFGLALGSGLVLDGSGTLVLDPAYFATVSGSSVQGTASGHGQFVFNTTSRTLMWDADGAGSQPGIALAKFNAGTALSAADFAITAITAPPGVGNIAISDVTITEGDNGTKTAIFMVSRTGGSSAFTVDFTTADGTATAGSDYEATSGTLSFADGQGSQTVSVTINGDTTSEPNETFFVALTNATNGGTIVDSQGLGTIITDDVVGNISISDVTITEGDAGTSTATFTVSRTGGSSAFSVDFATADGTATAGSDYEATSGTLSFADGQGSQTVSVTINGDTTFEPNETFFVALTNATKGGTIVDSQGLGTIITDDPIPGQPTVVAIHDTTLFGSGDPSGLAYIPTTGTLFLADSEHDESPYFSPINLHALETDGTLIQSYSMTSFTKEPTGLAFDPTTGYMFISDDSKHRVFWVDPANPTVKLGEFGTTAVGIADPDDIAVNPNDGHLFIISGTPNRNIVETNSTGTHVFSNITLPSTIGDPDALVYDAQADVFYVGMKSSYLIWEVDRGGTILDTIDVLSGYRNPVSGAKVKIDDLELAPSSNPNDDPSTLSLFVADYGADQVNDGRLFEIDLHGYLLLA